MKTIKKLAHKEFYFSLFLAFITLAVNWFIGYDSLCGFERNCNRGINPTMIYGIPLPLRTVGMYSGESINFPNVLLFIVLLSAFYLFLIKLVIYFKNK